MKIRKARKEDLDEIVKIFKIESTKKPYLQKWTTKKCLEKIKESFKKDDLLIALVDKKIMGFISSSITQNNKDKAYIDELWISARFQGKGIGKKLVKKVENMYKKKDVKIIQLVSHRKSHAYKFYKKLNYDDSKELAFMDKRLK